MGFSITHTPLLKIYRPEHTANILQEVLANRIINGLSRKKNRFILETDNGLYANLVKKKDSWYTEAKTFIGKVLEIYD